MTRTVQAVFDGEVFRPEEKVDLEPNTRVQITIQEEEKPKSNAYIFFRKARSFNLEGPPDWSERFEEYLYGREGDNDNE